MAKVTIGDRELDVKQATLGFLKKKLIPARKALVEASEEDTPDRMVDLVFCYVGHNDGVTREWLLDVLPADPTEIVRAVISASGQKVGTVQPGEAARP